MTGWVWRAALLRRPFIERATPDQEAEFTTAYGNAVIHLDKTRRPGDWYSEYFDEERDEDNERYVTECTDCGVPLLDRETCLRNRMSTEEATERVCLECALRDMDVDIPEWMWEEVDSTLWKF